MTVQSALKGTEVQRPPETGHKRNRRINSLTQQAEDDNPTGYQQWCEYYHYPESVAIEPTDQLTGDSI